MSEKWNYDERTGMVAVYAGEHRNCLETGEPFIFTRYFLRSDNGGFVRDDEACQVARQIVDDHERIRSLESDLARAREEIEVAHSDYRIQNDMICKLTDAVSAADERIVVLEGDYRTVTAERDTLRATVEKLRAVAMGLFETLNAYYDNRPESSRCESWHRAKAALLEKE